MMNPENTLSTLSELLEIENDQILIAIKCPNTGIPIWPLIRTEVLRHILYKTHYTNDQIISRPFGLTNTSLAIRTLYSLLHNTFTKFPTDIAIQIHASGEGRYRNSGTFDDRIIGHLARIQSSITTVHQAAPKGKIFEKTNFGPIFYETPAKIIETLESKIRSCQTSRNVSQLLLDRVKHNLKKHLYFELSKGSELHLASTLSSRLAMLPHSIKRWDRWFDKTKPKLILKENACYGGNSIPLILAAKRRQITVAEYQHGLISIGHDAYNVSENLMADESYQQTLPNYLLTYGEWWSKQTNLPITKIPIGNPHRADKIRTARKNKSKRNGILILSDGIDTNEYIKLANSISSFCASLGFDIIFRPHPRERHYISADQMPTGVRLDTHETVYQSFETAEVLISETSTAIFEAVGLVPNIYHWRTSKSNFTLPQHPFTEFKTIDQLFDILTCQKNSNQTNLNVPETQIWADSWSTRYLEFIRGELAQ